MIKLYSKEYSGTRHLLNPDRPYVHSSQTNIALTIFNEKARIAEEKAKTLYAQPKKVRRIK